MLWRPEAAVWESGPIRCSLVPAGFRLTVADVAEFFIPSRPGRLGCRALSSDRAAIRHARLRLARPLSLSYWGPHVMLHAAGLVCNGRAVCLVGPSGSGKSTLACYLSRRGARLLDDDVVQLKHRGSRGVWVQPGLPQVRLWPDSVRALLRAREQRGTGKQELPLSVASAPVRLGFVCLLEPGREKPEIARVRPTEALTVLWRQSFVLNPHDGASLARQLNRLSGVLESVPVYRLRVPHDYARLPDVASLLRETCPRVAGDRSTLRPGP